MSRLRGGLSAILNHEKKDSPYYRIAHYFAENIYKLKRISIQDIAKDCFVSKSTVSRFCRDVGYEDYFELNHDVYHLAETRFNKFLRYDQDSFEERASRYYRDLASGLEYARKYISQSDVEYLTALLFRYRDIVILGSLHSHSVSEYFQHDLGLLNKVVTAPMLPENQQEFIRSSDSNTLILVVSCRGNYFNQMIQDCKPQTSETGPYVLITNNPNMKNNALYDRVIYIPCQEIYAQHPRNISYFLNLVVLEYAYQAQNAETPTDFEDNSGNAQ